MLQKKGRKLGTFYDNGAQLFSTLCGMYLIELINILETDLVVEIVSARLSLSVLALAYSFDRR